MKNTEQFPRETVAEKPEKDAALQTLSSKIAVRKVQKLANLHAACFLREGDDIERMHDLTGEYWENSPVDVERYYLFCHSFILAKSGTTKFFRHEPIWGITFNNALILLLAGLITVMHDGRDNPIKGCLNMTLGDYTEALSELYRQRTEQPDASLLAAFQQFRKQEAEIHGTLELPMIKVMEENFEAYAKAAEPFYHLQYLLGAARACARGEEDWDEALARYESKNKIPRAQETLANGSRDMRRIYLRHTDPRLTDLDQLHFTCKHGGFDPEHARFIEEFAAKADLTECMLTINLCIIEIDNLFVSAMLKIFDEN